MAQNNDFLDRLIQERTELEVRLEKLENFMRTAEYRELESEHRDLLVVQREYMRRYKDVLDLRVIYVTAHRKPEMDNMPHANFVSKKNIFPF